MGERYEKHVRVGVDWIENYYIHGVVSSTAKMTMSATYQTFQVCDMKIVSKFHNFCQVTLISGIKHATKNLALGSLLKKRHIM